MANNTPISSGPTRAPLTTMRNIARSTDAAGQTFAGIAPNNPGAVSTMKQMYQDTHKFGVGTAGEVNAAKAEYARKLQQAQTVGMPHDKKPGI